MDLPPAYTPFVGREAELRSIGQALKGARLVTLTGPGGCGKTRLALECARQLAEAPASRRYADGAAWCDLAAVTDPGHVPARLLAALELAESDGADLTERIVAALQPQQRLVILDNCERLLAACAALAETLLARCPRLTLLATSTRPLGLPPEHVYSVPPLAVPELQAVPELPASLDAATFDALRQADAVRLFLLRAREAFASFEAGQDNITAIVTICRRLDGLPLAIELAAARVKLLSPAQIAERLDNAFALLTRGSPAGPPRHQTLRTAIDWSHALLAAPEQVLLRRLSVFGGSFDLEAVEAVCDIDAAQRAAPQLDALASLVDQSFVSIWKHEPAGVRYRLLETIRQYARERLDTAGEFAPSATRLLEWCAALAERAQPKLEGAAQAATFARLELEHDNQRAALRWALEAGRTEAGLRLAGALERFWLIHGHPSEGRDWLRQLLAQSGDPRPAPAIRARALMALALIATRQNDLDQAEACLREALGAWQALGDTAGIAVALNKLGDVAQERGDYAAAVELLSESLRLSHTLGRDQSVASVLISLAATVSLQGDHDRATALYEEALALCRRLGDQWFIAVVLNNLGAHAILRSDWDRAEALLHEALALRRALGDQRGTAIALANLSEIALRQQDWARARARAAESLPLFQQVNDRADLASSVVRLAIAADGQGQAARAARLLGINEQLRETIPVPMTPDEAADYDAIVTRVRASLDASALAAAWGEGRALPPADALAYAVSAPPEIAPSSVDLYVTALGRTAVLRAGTPLADADWRYAKARELFFYLLAQPRAAKAQLGLALYPEASPAQLRGRLHRVLHHARQALGSAAWIRFEDDEYAFNFQGAYWYDVEQFEQRLRAARAALAAAPRDAPLAIRLLQDAAALYGGDYLPELDSDWVLFRREALRHSALEALLELGRLLLAAGRPDQAVDAYRRVLELDNFLEVAHRGLMRGYARQGDAARARRHFERLRSLLRDELGSQPSPETARLDEQIRAGKEV